MTVQLPSRKAFGNGGTHASTGLPIATASRRLDLPAEIEVDLRVPQRRVQVVDVSSLMTGSCHRRALLHGGVGEKPVEVGQGTLADLVGLVGGDAEGAQEVFGDLVGGLGVVAVGLGVQELAEA